MGLISSLRGKKSTVGLDIGSHAIKLAEISKRKEVYYLEATGIKELPAGTIQGGDIKDREALIDAVVTLINQCDPSISDVVISMSGHGILSDKFIFTIDSNENAEEMILWEAGQRSPFDVDDITLDYKILRKVGDSADAEVLLAAAKNQIMQNYIDLLYEAGLRPRIVDVDAFAIYNCYRLESFGQAENGAIALLNVGHNLTTITFIKDGIYHSTRDISTAGDFFRKTLQRTLGISDEEANAILRGESNANIDQKQINQSVEFAAEELSSGIDLAFSYFKSSEKSDKVDKMVLSGGGAYIPGLSTMLGVRHETAVQVSNPLAFLKFDQNLFGTVNPQSISSFLTVAVGLALRRIEQ
jgi:type IV pilus assembly protein PilM